MKRHVLKNKNLKIFLSNLNEYMLIAGESNQYANSEIPQEYIFGTNYEIIGSFNNCTTNQGICVGIYDMDGVLMSNNIIFTEETINTFAFDGILVPTKTAIGEIRVYTLLNSMIKNLYFNINALVTPSNLTICCGNCEAEIIINIINGSATIPSNCPKCSALWSVTPTIMKGTILSLYNGNR